MRSDDTLVVEFPELLASGTKISIRNNRLAVEAPNGMYMTITQGRFNIDGILDVFAFRADATLTSRALFLLSVSNWTCVAATTPLAWDEDPMTNIIGLEIFDSELREKQMKHTLRKEAITCFDLLKMNVGAQPLAAQTSSIIYGAR